MLFLHRGDFDSGYLKGYKMLTAVDYAVGSFTKFLKDSILRSKKVFREQRARDRIKEREKGILLRLRSKRRGREGRRRRQRWLR